MGFRVKLCTLKNVWKQWRVLQRRCYSQAGAGAELSYFHNPGSEPLHYQTVGQLVSQAASRWPDREVFVSVQHDTRLTFSQAEQQACQLAAGFLSLGLECGDRLAICSPNTTQWFLTAIAAAKAGLILVSLNPLYMANELDYCLRKINAKALVTDEQIKSQSYYELLCEILPELSSLPQGAPIRSERLPNLSTIIINSDNYYPGTYKFSDIINGDSGLQKLHKVEQSLRPEHIGNIQFTSGTTGKPKAVPLSHFNLINNSYFFGKRLGLNKKHHKILAQSPFFHVLGYIGAMIASLNFGSTMVLPSPTFSVKHSSHAIKKEQCTMLIGTPTMYVDLCNHVSSLPEEEQRLHQAPELAVSGGALCLPELIRKMKSTFSCERVVSVYGLTETTAIIFQSEPQDSEFYMTSTVGRVSEHVEAKVVDDDGHTVPVGTAGELWVRSFNNMTGYWEDPESSANMFTPDRWIKTGDKFILLEGGYGQVVGRKKDMIIRGGENISPKEVEEYLITHPSIVDAQVYGVTSERLGEEVACSLRTKDNVQLTVEEVRQFCLDQIARYKIPKYLEIRDKFPTTGSGKVQKFKLREEMEKKLKNKSINE